MPRHTDPVAHPAVADHPVTEPEAAQAGVRSHNSGSRSGRPQMAVRRARAIARCRVDSGCRAGAAGNRAPTRWVARLTLCAARRSSGHSGHVLPGGGRCPAARRPGHDGSPQNSRQDRGGKAGGERCRSTCEANQPRERGADCSLVGGGKANSVPVAVTAGYVRRRSRRKA